MPYSAAAEALRTTQQKALTVAVAKSNASLTNPEAFRNAQAEIQEINEVLAALRTSQLTLEEIADEAEAERQHNESGYAATL